jgi:chaperone modulatory protein CbpM
MSETEQGPFSLTEVSEITGIDRSTIVTFIRLNWICPMTADEIDQEDLARLRLIQDLKNTFGANDEAVPLILHLMDQLYSLRHQLKKYGRSE